MHYLWLKVHWNSADRQMVDLFETHSIYTYMYIQRTADGCGKGRYIRLIEFDKFNKVILIEFYIFVKIKWFGVLKN